MIKLFKLWIVINLENIFLMKILSIVFHILNTGELTHIDFYESLKFNISVTFHEKTVIGQLFWLLMPKLKSLTDMTSSGTINKGIIMFGG
jgi:hypothetical protein